LETGVALGAVVPHIEDRLDRAALVGGLVPPDAADIARSESRQAEPPFGDELRVLPHRPRRGRHDRDRLAAFRHRH
jgi:hypothetical protein